MSAALGAWTATVLAAGPVLAHEEINPATVPTGKPVFLTLTAANERPVDLTSVRLAAPPGVPFGATTRQPPGWRVDRSDTSITWSGGSVKADTFEQWGFEIEGADQPGALTYKVTLAFADGAHDDVDVIVTVAAGTAPTASTPPGVTTAAATPAKPKAVTSDASARRRANLALGLGAVAVVVALVAVATGGTRTRRMASPTGADGDDAQDW